MGPLRYQCLNQNQNPATKSSIGSGTFNLSQRVLGSSGLRPLLHSQISRGSGSHYTTEYKLQLDLEQARSIANGGYGGTVPMNQRMYFASHVVPAYENVLARIPRLELLSATGGLYPFGAEDTAAGIVEVYNRAIYMPAFPEFTIDSHYFGAGLRDVASVEARWAASKPQIIVVDDLLSPSALESLRRLLADSTVWYQTKMPQKFGGYVGAYIDDGLHQVLLQFRFLV